MGCVCSKGVSTSPKRSKEKNQKKKSSKRFNVASKEDAVCVGVDNGGIDATTRLILTENAERSAGSTPPSRGEEAKPNGAVEKSSELSISQGSRRDVGSHVMNGVQPQISRVFSVRDGVDGAQVVAGWPSWLSAVAGEAIKGWVPRKADSFERLDKIGQGTYSSVYRARDLESGKIVALKKVRFVNMDPESVRFMAREILILRRLDHPNIMKLEGLVTSRASCNLYLVFEYMEHDLTGLAASPKVKFTEPQIKCYMQQLLRGLDHCHSRGVLHRDIKGSNLLIDNNGNLKIGDFGLATFYRANQRQPLTSRVVTLWYRPPELLLGATDYGPAVDLWSAGCILAELFAGKPIMPGRTEVEQLHKIFKLCGSPSEEYWRKSKLPHATIFKPQQPYKRTVAETFKEFPPSVLSLLDSLLAFEPECRGAAASALQSEFFTRKPLPCDPSALPKYPPSKEFDAKNRDEEARRQKAAGSRGRDLESSRRGCKDSKAVPAPEANAELPSSIQRWQAQSNAKSNSEKFFPEGDGGSGYPFDHSGRSLYKSVLAHNAAPKSVINMPVGEAWGHDGSVGHSSKYSSELGILKAYKPHGPAEHLSRFSNSVGVNGGSRFDLSRNDSTRSHWPGERLHAKDNQLRGADSSHRWMGGPSASHKKDEVTSGVEYPMGYGSKKSKINYSGPLLPPDGSIEDMLKEHERQIQQAVRKAREKNRNMKAYRDNLHAESLLQYVGNAQ